MRRVRWGLVLLGTLTASLALATNVKAAPSDDDDEGGKPAVKGEGVVIPMTQPIATIRMHVYPLSECLLLAERNSPVLWAARARLGNAHGQLDEAKYTPFSMWSASAQFGYLPPIGGTPFYNASPYTILYQGFGDGWEPAFALQIHGTLPIYTFGKIENVKKAAEGRVRVQEWDLEKNRQQVRADVRRAYYGLMLARDMQYIAGDVLQKLQKAIDNVTAKLERGDPSTEESARFRLEYSRDELMARVAEAKKGELTAIAALRFLTGVQTNFDIPDEPLKRPDIVLGPVVRYLTAARLFRADLNMARAGVTARKAFLEYRKSDLFPNFGLGLGASYAIAPSADPQRTAWIGDGFNRFGYSFGLGMDWSLDLLPKQARIDQAAADLEETRALERYALGGAAFEVEQAYAAVVEAKTREENWERAERRSKRWFVGIQDAIDLGTKDEGFLLEPLRAFVSARANHAQSLMDLNITLSELARVTGWDAAAPSS